MNYPTQDAYDAVCAARAKWQARAEVAEAKLAVRLLPLVEKAPNDGLANCLARLLVDDATQAEDGARASLLILTGIQAFLDSNGDYRAVEAAWEPSIVARHMLKAYGDEAWRKAAEMCGGCKAVEDERGAYIYARVAEMLAPEDVKKRVDSQ
jgi:hypothetical protein